MSHAEVFSVNQYDLLAIAAACCACFIAGNIALRWYRQAKQNLSRRPLMVAAASTAAGLGTWISLIAVGIAYRPWQAFAYDTARTALALIIALEFSALGFVLSLSRRRRGTVLGGAVIGLGMMLATWTSTTGIGGKGHIDLDPLPLGISLAISTCCGGLAMWVQREQSKGIAIVSNCLMAIAALSPPFAMTRAGKIDFVASHMTPDWSITSSDMLILLVIAGQLLLGLVGALVIFNGKTDAAALALAYDRTLTAKQRANAATQRRKLARELRRQVKISKIALENMAQGLSMYDADNRLVIVNRQYRDLYGVPDELLVQGTHFAQVSQNIASRLLAFAPPPEHLRDAGVWTGESDVVLKDGRVISYQRRELPGGGWVATHQDVTQARRSQERISYLAAHDNLTALPNRSAFRAELETRLRGTANFAIHTIDLDRFKEVNDTLGHPIGDQILRAAASRLQLLIDENDVVARLGGDEFAIIQTLAGAASPTALAAEVVNRLSQPFEFDGHTIIIGASVGVSLAPAHGSNGDELLKKSDLALYGAKEGSRGTYRLFEEGMDSRLIERRQLEEDLRRAIGEGQFEVHYQPLLDMENGRIGCFEALVRWRHPERGLMQPAQFIATAEDSGLIVPIGEWVLRQACRDAVNWPDDVKVAVNLSPAQFKRGDLIAMTMSALTAAGLPSRRLELEITESVLLHDENWVHSVLERLSHLGVSIAMDDFGTGYSSLSYLRSFPFTKIKIDRSFVTDLVSAPDALSIVQATIQLSQKLGMQITAEGVETEQQLEILAAEGCTQVQGFHISRPVLGRDVTTLLDRYNSAARGPSKAAG